MIEIISGKISAYVYRHNDRQNVSLEVMQFALTSILTNVISILLSLIIGLLTGLFWQTVLALVGVAIIRNLAGGYHFRSSTVCVVVSTAAVVITPYIPVTTPVFYGLTALSLLLLFIYAPSGLRNMTRITDRGLRVMKAAAMIVVLCNLVIHSDTLSVAFFVASVSLISFKRR